jgi:hypothetical protein
MVRTGLYAVAMPRIGVPTTELRSLETASVDTACSIHRSTLLTYSTSSKEEKSLEDEFPSLSTV